MIPTIIYLPNRDRYFDAYANKLVDNDITYVSLDAIKEFIYCNHGADDFMEKFEEFVKE